MQVISPSLMRSWYLWLRIKKILADKWITVTDIADKANVARPSLSNVLNWKSAWSDNMFRLAMEAIPLTETEIQKIFMEADKEEFI